MKNLNLPISILIIPLLLHSYVKSEDVCEDRNVIGAVGGAITLNARYTEVRKMIWSFGKSGAIATTRPGGPIEIDNNRYKGRLRSTSDGSLIITELRLEDGGEYRVQIITDRETLHCNYHLTVFSNLTTEDVTISSNGTNNETCEGSFTCSVNGSNVTVTWRSVNSSDITGTRNVVFVPPRNVNFTYVCTAQNPVSEVSKTVHPWEYCQKKETDSHHSEQRIVFGYAAVPFVVFIIIVVLCVWNYCRKRKIIAEGEDLNEERAALKQIANTYEMTGEDCTGNNEALGDEHAGTQAPNVKQPIPSRVKGTAGMDKNPHTMELQENQSNETTDKSLYSTVLHVKEPQESQSNFTTSNTVYSTVLQPKQKNNQTKQPSPSNGNPSKAPLKPTRQMLESPMDKSYQQAPLESCYAQVKLPKPTEM